MSFGPSLGCQIGESIGGLGREAAKDVFEIVERIDAVQLAAGDHAVEDRSATAAFVVAGKQPVLTSHSNPA